MADPQREGAPADRSGYASLAAHATLLGAVNESTKAVVLAEADRRAAVKAARAGGAAVKAIADAAGVTRKTIYTWGSERIITDEALTAAGVWPSGVTKVETADGSEQYEVVSVDGCHKLLFGEDTEDGDGWDSCRFERESADWEWLRDTHPPDWHATPSELLASVQRWTAQRWLGMTGATSEGGR